MQVGKFFRLFQFIRVYSHRAWYLILEVLKIVQNDHIIEPVTEVDLIEAAYITCKIPNILRLSIVVISAARKLYSNCKNGFNAFIVFISFCLHIFFFNGQEIPFLFSSSNWVPDTITDTCIVLGNREKTSCFLLVLDRQSFSKYNLQLLLEWFILIFKVNIILRGYKIYRWLLLTNIFQRLLICEAFYFVLCLFPIGAMDKRH